MHEENNTVEYNNTDVSNWFTKIKRYKLHLSVSMAVIIVGISALSHFKNEKAREELVKAIDEYRKELVLIGAEIDYSSVECSGIFSTDCEIEQIRLSLMGQEQLSIQSLRFGNVEEYSEFKDFANGKNISASFDLEANGVKLPKPLIAQVVAQNVSGLFQASALEKLDTIDLAVSGEIEGDTSLMKHLHIEQFMVDNAIMPIEFSMEANNVSESSPDAMVIESFSFSARNRAISDVTYESIKQLYGVLNEEEKQMLLKEFSLTADDIENKTKASAAINNAIAKRLENDAGLAAGFVEKELITGMAKILKGEAKEVVLIGKNRKNMTVSEVQKLLVESANMEESEAKDYMQDKFTLEVKID